MTPRPVAFASPAALRSWLEKHHATERELVIRCYKNHARYKGVTYVQALQEALCYGWIDGVRRSLDQESFAVRFTPRKPVSKWSALNIKYVRALRAAGRMHASGLAAFRGHRARRQRPYSYEAAAARLSPAYARRLRADTRAWRFFQSQPPWYRRTSVYWIMSAKREETRERRFEMLLTFSRRGKAIPPLDRAPKR